MDACRLPFQKSPPTKIESVLKVIDLPIISLTTEQHGTPLQRDDFNCGVYAMMMVRAWAEGKKIFDSQTIDLREERRRIVLELSRKYSVTYKRTTLTDEQIRNWNTWTLSDYVSKRKATPGSSKEDEDEDDEEKEGVAMRAPLPGATPTQDDLLDIICPGGTDSERPESPPDFFPGGTDSHLPKSPPDFTPGGTDSLPTESPPEFFTGGTGYHGIKTPGPPSTEPSSSQNSQKRVGQDSDATPVKRRRTTRTFLILTPLKISSPPKPTEIVQMLQSFGIHEIRDTDICSIRLVLSRLRNEINFVAFELTSDEATQRLQAHLEKDGIAEDMFERNQGKFGTRASALLLTTSDPAHSSFLVFLINLLHSPHLLNKIALFKKIITEDLNHIKEDHHLRKKLYHFPKTPLFCLSFSHSHFLTSFVQITNPLAYQLCSVPF